MKNSHKICLCSDLWCRGFIETWNTKPHTEHLRRSPATPASPNLLHQYFQPLPFLTAHHLPLIYSWCVFYIWPACFTIQSQTSSIWSLESTSTKPSTDLELNHLTTQLSLSLLPSPASLVFWNVLQAFGNFGGWQNNTVPKNITEDSLHFLSAKPSLLCSWQPYERAKYYQLHKWTKIAENSRVPATKLQSSSEKRAVIPLPYAQSLKWECVRIVTSSWQPD